MVLSYGIHKGDSHWGVHENRPPGYSRIYFATGGKGYYNGDNNKGEFIKGHIYLLPTAKVYSLSQERDTPFACTFFHYDFFPQEFKTVIDINMNDHPFLRKLHQPMKLAIELGGGALFNSLAEAFIIYCHDQKLTLFSSGILTPVLEYIGENIREDLSLSNLSLRAGYNEQYFIRLFKKEMGMTPHQYVIAYRIKEARKHLLQGKSVTATAKETGFSDVKTFSRCFKKSTSLSPSAFLQESPRA